MTSNGVIRDIAFIRSTEPMRYNEVAFPASAAGAISAEY